MNKSRTIILSLLGVVALVAGAVVVYQTFIAADAPEEFTLEPTASPEAPVVDGIDGEWVITSGEGGFRVEEVLFDVATTAVGRTPGVTGTLTVRDDELVAGTVTLDLTGITTGNSGRDTFFRQHLQVSDFPSTTFTFTESLDVSAIDDGAITTDVAGALTIAGVTRDVVVTVDAQRDGADINVVGSIRLDYTTFELEAPSLGFAEVEPDVIIEVRFTASR